MFIGVYNVIVDFARPNSWDQNVIDIYKLSDILLTLVTVSAASYFWLITKKKNYRTINLIAMLTVAFIVIWSVVICGFDYNSTGFSTYLGTLLLSLLFIDFKPVYSILLSWGSATLLVALVFILNH